LNDYRVGFINDDMNADFDTDEGAGVTQATYKAELASNENARLYHVSLLCLTFYFLRG
jgi:hypothetical protein